LWKLIEQIRAEITVDLQDRNITAGTVVVPFTIDDYTAWRLLEGLDDIGLTLRKLGDRGFRSGAAGWKPTTSGLILRNPFRALFEGSSGPTGLPTGSAESSPES
jgi:hypothetical protein